MAMNPRKSDNRSFRGMLQSGDGVILRVTASNPKTITFETAFRMSEAFAERLKDQPEHLVFSERSRIARLGVNIRCESPRAERLTGDRLILKLEASSAIPGYPTLGELKGFFSPGLPVGRLVYCNPDSLLTSEEVLEAIDRSALKLPASTTVSSDGSILISPHKVVCRLKPGLDRETIGKILFRKNGREILNRYLLRQPVSALTIPPGEGVVTTCSMYLNDHYVALQSSFSLGEHLPATILDPIKTRGISIYLEILNGSSHPIVNPLISAKVYRVSKPRKRKAARVSSGGSVLFSFEEMTALGQAMDRLPAATCHYLDKPVAVIPNKTNGISAATLLLNGPEDDCPVTEAACSAGRLDYASKIICTHRYATETIREHLFDVPGILALKYFPNLLEHRDIINLACDGLVRALYFFEASCEHGPFLSDHDHVRLMEYEAFGVDIYWVSGLNNRLMVHTIRDGKGYFVAPERLADFHKSMLFAFYGSNQVLSEEGGKRLRALMDALIRFWGNHIGIVTGGGSGVMEQANTMARERGILSGANFLDITDQALTTDVDFCQVFQSTCRHSRQKWFEIASFPIFNVGGLGSLEELGITLCNMKLSISDPVPVILFDTETKGAYWAGVKTQIDEMIRLKRAPEWIRDNLILTDDPQVVVNAYRDKLHLF